MLGQMWTEDILKMSSNIYILVGNRKRSNIKKSLFFNCKIHACICINIVASLVYRDNLM